MKNCIWCEKETTNREISKFCSNTCQQKHQRNLKISKWLIDPILVLSVSSVMKTYLLEQSNNQCSECGWSKINLTTNKIPLEVDHINGISKDNRIENLRVLCPNCHSLTPTYKGANKKSSRTYRKTLEVKKNIIRINKQNKLKAIKDLVLDANINFSESGWVTKVSNILEISPQKTRNWMKRNFPEIEKIAHKRK
mgnify:CR=1 FL=1|tara:strand:- start:373 stop:957 length:585 start_codon:yes stop_codon:yes gene_type:complete